jgi:FkbM family methyltransferase
MALMTEFVDHPTLDRQPCRHGPMCFFRHDRFIGRSLSVYGEWAQFELAWLLDLLRPGDTVIDAGANVGTHTVPFAQAVGPTGHVHAFEPQGQVADVLEANLELNGLPQATVHRAAVGAAAGRIVVPRLNVERELNLGGVSLGLFASGEGDEVPLQTLDALELPDCRLIKIDVEGMEADALAGATATLRRCRPILYVENDRPGQIQPLLAAIAAQGYRSWWHVATFYNPDNAKGMRKNVFPDLYAMNLLCLPPDSAIEPSRHPHYRARGPAPGASALQAAAFGLPILGGEVVFPAGAA